MKQYFNPSDPDIIHDPYRAYAAFRTLDPVHWNADQQTYYVFRYHDVVRVLSDTVHFRRGALQEEHVQGMPSPLKEIMQDFLFELNPPQHTRMRSVLPATFPRSSKQDVEALRPRIGQLTRALLDQAPPGPKEMMRTLAYPLPIILTQELLFGAVIVAPNQLRQHASQFVAIFDEPTRLDLQAQANTAATWFEQLCGPLIAEWRERPRQNALSHLLAPQQQGVILSDAEALALCISLLLAGFEATANLIGNGIRALVEHPDQLAGVRASPKLWKKVPDECGRLYSSPQFNQRLTRLPITLSGMRIPADAVVIAMQGAANRDPDVFFDPDHLRLDRPDKPRPISFGAGTFACIGAPLARLVAQDAYREVFARWSTPRLARMVMGDTLGFFGPRELSLDVL